MLPPNLKQNGPYSIGLVLCILEEMFGNLNLYLQNHIFVILFESALGYKPNVFPINLKHATEEVTNGSISVRA